VSDFVNGYCERVGLAVGVGPGGVIVGVLEAVGVCVGVGVFVGNVGIGVGVCVAFGVLLGLMVAVACGVSGVHVGCKDVAVAVGTVGIWAMLAIVGSRVGISCLFENSFFTSLLN